METMSTRIDELPDADVPMTDMEETQIPQQPHDLSKYNDNNTNIHFDIVKNNNNSRTGVSDSLLTQFRNQINEENLILLAVVSIFMLTRTSNYIGNIPFVSRFGNNEIVFPIFKASLAVISFLFVKNTVLKYLKL